MPDARVFFTVPGPPTGKARARTVRTPQGHTRSYTPAKTASRENLVMLCYREAAPQRAPHDGPVSLMIVSYHPIPASWPAKKRERATGTPCCSKPDADNVLKLVADALNKVAWTDDSRITTALIEKRYSGTAGLDVTIEFHGA